MLEFEDIEVLGIEIDEGYREIDREAVEALKQSITAIGLRTPITIRACRDDDGDNWFRLVAGRHRLKAYEELGFKYIPAFVIQRSDPINDRLWYLSENLHRAELTVIQRSEMIAEWVSLTSAQEADAAQLAPIESRDQEKPAQLAQVSAKGGRGLQGGISAATKALNLERTQVQRAVKIASITPEAKIVATEAGITSQAGLLKVAAAAPEDQVAVARTLAQPAPTEDLALKWRKSMLTLWNEGRPEWQAEFREMINAE